VTKVSRKWMIAMGHGDEIGLRGQILAQSASARSVVRCLTLDCPKRFQQSVRNWAALLSSLSKETQPPRTRQRADAMRPC